jgi:hypothetical protein
MGAREERGSHHVNLKDERNQLKMQKEAAAEVHREAEGRVKVRRP